MLLWGAHGTEGKHVMLRLKSFGSLVWGGRRRRRLNE